MAATSIETPFWSPMPPVSALAWGALFGGCVLVLVFNTSVALGIALTSPLFISIGTELTIPVHDCSAANPPVDALQQEEQ